MQAMAQAKRLNVESIASLIFQHHNNPARKIAGLNQLTKQGTEVRIGQELDILLINGERCEWRALEYPHNWGAFIL